MFCAASGPLYEWPTNRPKVAGRRFQTGSRLKTLVSATRNLPAFGSRPVLDLRNDNARLSCAGHEAISSRPAHHRRSGLKRGSFGKVR